MSLEFLLNVVLWGAWALYLFSGKEAMDQTMSEETGKSLLVEMKNLASEMAKFNDLFRHNEKKKKAERSAKELSKKVGAALRKHL